MLKRTILCLAVGVFAHASASAQTPDPRLAPTVELRIVSTGQSVKTADYVTIYVPISTNADTTSSARAANNAAIAKLTNALVAHGVGRDAITVIPSSGRMGFIGNEAYDPSDASSEPASVATLTARKSAFSTVRIRLTTIASLDGVQAVLDQQNLTMLGGPLYSLNDDRVARNAAVADAIVKAKQDADAYAAPLGMRVERITSVSNYGDATPTVPDANFLMQMMIGSQEPASGSVTTRVQVWVNFVLGPR